MILQSLQITRLSYYINYWIDRTGRIQYLNCVKLKLHFCSESYLHILFSISLSECMVYWGSFVAHRTIGKQRCDSVLFAILNCKTVIFQWTFAKKLRKDNHTNPSYRSRSQLRNTIFFKNFFQTIEHKKSVSFNVNLILDRCRNQQ